MIRKILLLGIIICIGLGLWCSQHLTYDFNTDPLALSSRKQQAEFKAYQEAFQSYPEAITIGVEKQALFENYTTFLELQSLTDSILALPGVEKVESIERIKIPSREVFYVVETLFLPLYSEEHFLKKYADLKRFKDITQKFLSEDRSALCFYVFLDKEKELESIISIRSLLEKSPFDAVHILGAPAFKAEGNKVLQQETIGMCIMGCLLLLISMFFFIPSIERLAITLLFTSFNVCMTLIFMYLLHIEITTFTSIIPCVIAIFSFTDILHILYHYDKEKAKNTPDELIKKHLFKAIGIPLILTSVSNLIGFSIFFFNGGISQITDLALVASFGIIFAYTSSRFILPQTLKFNKKKRLEKRLQAIEGFLASCANFILRQHRRILILFMLVFGLVSFVVFQLSKINMYYYERDNEAIAINKACAFYDDQFQGIRDIEVVIQSKGENILNGETIKTIDTIEKYLIDVYACKSTFSINTIIKRFNRFLRAGDPDRYEIPKNLSSAFFKRMEKREEELGVLSIVSDDHSSTRIIGSLPDIGTAKARARNRDLNKFLSQFNTPEQNVFINGKAFLFDESVYNLSRFVLVTIAIGIFLIGIFTGFLFKSLWVGFTIFLANSLPLLFGVLLFYIFKVDLNPASVFMLSIIMGIALDDSIYILGHYYNSIKEKADKKKLLFTSLKSNSAPLLITSLVLGLSFLSLCISSYQSIFSFGIIMSLSLFFAFISDLFFMPAMLYWGINRK